MGLKRKIRILWTGEWLENTGFGSVSINIVTRLHQLKNEYGADAYEICVMALGPRPNPFDASNKYPFPVIPMYGNPQAAPFGQDTARDMVQRFKPDIVVAFGDTWMVDYWNDRGIIPEDLRKSFKLVTYVAIDGYPVPEFWIDKYKNFDKVITFTKFGKDSIDERAKAMGVKLDTAYINHGVNPFVFKPLPQSDIDNFKAQRGISGKKVIGMFSRNQPRKHHPEFVEAAVEVVKAFGSDPNVVFYFHTVQRDAGWDLPALIKDIDTLKNHEKFEKYGTVGPNMEVSEGKAGLEGRFIFPGFDHPTQFYPLELLNMMYNMCDVHVLLTSGEGWGLTLSESLSAGVPTFTNDYAAGQELVKNSKGGEVIKARAYSYRGSDHNFYRPHTDYKDLLEKVMPVLNDPELRKKYGKKGRAWALGNSWDNLILDWQQQLESLYVKNLESPKVEVI